MMYYQYHSWSLSLTLLSKRIYQQHYVFNIHFFQTWNLRKSEITERENTISF